MAQNKDLVADAQTLLEENLSEKKSEESARRLPSTRQHENGVFKKIHSGERFRKDSFLVTENAVSVWTLTQNG